MYSLGLFALQVLFLNCADVIFCLHHKTKCCVVYLEAADLLLCLPSPSGGAEHQGRVQDCRADPCSWRHHQP
jgi:hypothetical protein